MPVTPFHLGPALLLKPVLRQRFSLIVFALVQVGIDIEVVVQSLAGASSLHVFIHTFLGATLLSLLLVVPARYLASGINRAVRRVLEQRDFDPRRLQGLGPLTWTCSVASALLGGGSHVLFDSIIHTDIQPLAPWSAHNPFFVAGSFNTVHVVFAAAGSLGLALWYLAARYRSSRSSSGTTRRH